MECGVVNDIQEVVESLLYLCFCDACSLTLPNITPIKCGCLIKKSNSITTTYLIGGCMGSLFIIKEPTHAYQILFFGDYLKVRESLYNWDNHLGRSHSKPYWDYWGNFTYVCKVLHDRSKWYRNKNYISSNIHIPYSYEKKVKFAL